MSDFYGPQHRTLQHNFDSFALADRVSELIVTPEITPEHQGFIESRVFFPFNDHRSSRLPDLFLQRRKCRASQGVGLSDAGVSDL